jgi:hypothetical protein
VNIIRHNGPAVAAAALATALAGGLAACGPTASSSTAGAASPGAASSGPAGAGSPGAASSGAGSPTAASSDPLAGMSADAIATKAWAGTKAAASVHVDGSTMDSGKQIKFSLTLVKGKGCAGTMSEGASGSFRIVMVGKDVWIKPDDAFWKASGGSDPAVLSIVSGKYIKDSAGTGLGAMSSLCNLSNWIGSAGQAAGMVKGATATVNGQPALQLKDTGDTASAWVADTASPVLLRLADPSSGGGSFDFTGYGATTTITAPRDSQTVDGKKYGF